MERAVREKRFFNFLSLLFILFSSDGSFRAAEGELEKLMKGLPVESERVNLVMEEMNTKLKISERERADYARKVERYSKYH